MPSKSKGAWQILPAEGYTQKNFTENECISSTNLTSLLDNSFFG